MSEDRQRRRLEQELETLEKQHGLWTEKLNRLSEAKISENDPATIFKLDTQIAQAQAEIDRLKLKIRSLEEQLSSDLPPSKLIPKTNKIDESIVRSILNDESPNLDQPEQPQSISRTSPLPNPFIPLTGRVEDPAQFFEPQGVINNVFETLNSGSSVALIGERGMGKSSILKAIERLAPERLNRQAIYLDWNLIPNEDTFWELVCHGIGVPRCHNHHLIRELQSRRLLLLLDEVEKMGQQEFGAEIRSQLRGFAQGSSMKVIITACVSLDLLFPDAHNSLLSPFAGLCMEERIPRWNEEMMRKYIADRLAGNPIQFTAIEIEQIVQTSQGQPQQLVKDCYQLYRQYRNRYDSK